uniref:HECT domain-containing protein n=1 Tax=Macrostomum lignano TaxID=282301 RepID=A0A1I8F9Z0_9PLAT
HSESVEDNQQMDDDGEDDQDDEELEGTMYVNSGEDASEPEQPVVQQAEYEDTEDDIVMCFPDRRDTHFNLSSFISYPMAVKTEHSTTTDESRAADHWQSSDRLHLLLPIPILRSETGKYSFLRNNREYLTIDQLKFCAKYCLPKFISIKCSFQGCSGMSRLPLQATDQMSPLSVFIRQLNHVMSTHPPCTDVNSAASVTICASSLAFKVVPASPDSVTYLLNRIYSLHQLGSILPMSSISMKALAPAESLTLHPTAATHLANVFVFVCRSCDKLKETPSIDCLEQLFANCATFAAPCARHNPTAKPFKKTIEGCVKHTIKFIATQISAKRDQPLALVKFLLGNGNLPAFPNSMQQLASFRSLPKEGAFKPSNELLLSTVILYKQATEGPCRQPRPGFWDRSVVQRDNDEDNSGCCCFAANGVSGGGVEERSEADEGEEFCDSLDRPSAAAAWRTRGQSSWLLPLLLLQLRYVAII